AGLLGQIDEAIFTNVFAIGMRELQELSTLDDTSAADELYKLSTGLDRVSLVDVLRGLKQGRRDLVGEEQLVGDANIDKMIGLVEKRNSLRNEIEQLTRTSRRWNELATQRRSGAQEIEQLTDRIAQWEFESKHVEAATGVWDAWRQRESIAEYIAKTESEIDLPDEAPGQLVQIDAALESKQVRLDEIKDKRRLIREKARQLPVSRAMLRLQSRIEAAGEQATWIEALEEQIARLDSQIEKAKQQLINDAERLGLDEEDRYAIAEGRTHAMPDLSRDTLASLSDPAKEVKEQTFKLKQARDEGAQHKATANKYAESLTPILERTRSEDIHDAIRRQNWLVTKLKHRLQIGRHYEKLQRHYAELEKESVELITNEALPIDRMLLLGIPFVVGGVAFFHGLLTVLGIEWFVEDADQGSGALMMMFGGCALAICYLAYERGLSGFSLDREDNERQIDTLKRQLRETEAERNELDDELPGGSGTIEQRLRDAEQLGDELEAALPGYHQQQAAIESYKLARERAQQAADGLRAAKRRWTETLEELGLSPSLSPNSIRKLGDGYQTLQSSRRRLDELISEREERQRERGTIAARIETLYMESLVRNDDSVTEVFEDEEDQEEDHRSRLGKSERSPSRSTPSHATPAHATPASRLTPLEQLNQLHDELGRHQHWIKRRRDLKDQDSQLKKSQSAVARAMDRYEQQRRSLWAKCGVATAEQFYEMVDTKAQLKDQREKHDELDKQIRSIIGTHLKYADVAMHIDGANESDLEKRWETLTTRITETQTRIDELRTAAGQLSQEMKHLGQDQRLSTARLELGCTQRRIQSVVLKWQTLGVTSLLLEEVCQTFERERQPETLREASSFLSQLTNGKYVRIWTPLGTNALRIEDSLGESLALEVLSRGTREAVFIALRLSLAASYARRGVTLPLILDDVLVNFDGDRAMHAAKTLHTFAQLGHQVMMFTCHRHIVDIFHEIGVQVRRMPPQGEPGRAYIWEPEHLIAEEPEVVEEEETEVEYVQAYEPEPEVEPEPIVEEVVEEIVEEIVEPTPDPEPEPVVLKKPAPARRRPKLKKVEPVVEIVEPEPEPSNLDWAWFERESTTARVVSDLEATEERLAAMDSEYWSDAPAPRHDAVEEEEIDGWIGEENGEIPDEVWNAGTSNSWWK
ncbi:MAG: hypothetical protein AAF664_15785, partial [Planctomycetota bacterium]